MAADLQDLDAWWSGMLRSAAGTLLLLSVLVTPTRAEHIGIQHKPEQIQSDFQLKELALSVESFLLETAGWRQTPGTDVYRLQFDDWNVQVKVFGNFQDSGSYDRNCCISFDSGSGWFSLKFRGARKPEKTDDGLASDDVGNSVDDAVLLELDAQVDRGGSILPSDYPGDSAVASVVAQVAEPHSSLLLVIGVMTLFARSRQRPIP